jgi:hypothetical protein
VIDLFRRMSEHCGDMRIVRLLLKTTVERKQKLIRSSTLTDAKAAVLATVFAASSAFFPLQACRCPATPLNNFKTLRSYTHLRPQM